MSQLQLSLLGTPVVKHGEHTLTFSTRKALALLVYLAVEGGTHPRKTLSEAFWPELDAEHGRAALRATLLELRKLLERSHGPGERAHLLIERETLGFDQGSPLLLDLRLVESASKQVGRGIEPVAGQAARELLAQLEQATRLARGPFLAGFTLRDSQFFDDWTRQYREYWHLRVHQLFDTLSLLSRRSRRGFTRVRQRPCRAGRATAGRAGTRDCGPGQTHSPHRSCTYAAVAAASRFTRTATSEPARRPVPGTNSRVRHLDRALPARACGTASARPTPGGDRDRQNAPGQRICRLGTGARGRCAGGESPSNREAAPVPVTHRCPAPPAGAGTCPR